MDEFLDIVDRIYFKKIALKKLEDGVTKPKKKNTIIKILKEEIQRDEKILLQIKEDKNG